MLQDEILLTNIGYISPSSSPSADMLQDEILLCTIEVVQSMADSMADGVPLPTGEDGRHISLALLKVLLLLQTPRCRDSVREASDACLGRLACVFSPQAGEAAGEASGEASGAAVEAAKLALYEVHFGNMLYKCAEEEKPAPAEWTKHSPGFNLLDTLLRRVGPVAGPHLAQVRSDTYDHTGGGLYDIHYHGIQHTHMTIRGGGCMTYITMVSVYGFYWVRKIYLSAN
jgi:hypothetical protein